MSQKNRFPRTAAHRSAGLFFIFSLGLLFLAATPHEGFAQGSRPVARLITATPEPAELPVSHHATARTAPAAVASAPVAASGLERRAFDLVNAERAKRGLAPLQWDGDVCRVARLHSEKMARLNFFDHDGPDGDLPGRMRASGVRWRSLGENIALNQGFNDPAALAVDQWMHSPGHRDNILRGIFTHSAIGIARSADGRVYLTQVFITR